MTSCGWLIVVASGALLGLPLFLYWAARGWFAGKHDALRRYEKLLRKRTKE